MKQTLHKFWREHRHFILFMLLIVGFRSAIADWNVVPTGSMKPTIVEGDRITVNKLAYDLRIPLTPISLLTLGEPQRGDIVVFDSAAAGKRLVKRVIGLPGDTVAMFKNRVSINGRVLDYTLVKQTQDSIVLREMLDHHPHLIKLKRNALASSAEFAPLRVPAGHYLVLGDNRDNSADSRYIGFVPRAEMVGRASRVVMSLDYDDHYLPRTDRLWQPLDG